MPTSSSPTRDQSTGHSQPDRAVDFSILAQTHRQKFLEGRGTGRETFFQKGFPPRKLFHQNKKSPAGTGDDQNHMQGEKSFVARRGANR